MRQPTQCPFCHSPDICRWGGIDPPPCQESASQKRIMQLIAIALIVFFMCVAWLFSR